MTQPIEMLVDTLEGRRLMSGLTMITHGYNGDVDGWVATAAADVQGRIGSTRTSSVYTMSVTARSGKLSVSSFAPDKGQRDFRKTSAGELIVKLDWSSVSNGGYETQTVARAVSDYLKTAHGSVPALAGLSTHLIGHSRGASLMTALSQDLGQSGIWVDQQTNLDPHPVDGVDDIFGFDFGDQKMATYDNVLFADTYWRTDGNANNQDFDGEPVSGTFNGDLNATVQKNFFVSAHGAVTAYYNGTIDVASLDGGDHPVIPSWYKNTKTAPARTRTGYFYSRVSAGARAPSGLNTLVGGTGKRSDAGESGSQWTNAFGVNTRKITSITRGRALQTRFYVEDRDSTARVEVYADTDANPYNGNTYVGGANIKASDLKSGRINASTSGLSPGAYYIAVRAGRGSEARWDYTNYRVTVVGTPAVRAATFSTVPIASTATPVQKTNDLEDLIEA